MHACACDMPGRGVVHGQVHLDGRLGPASWGPRALPGGPHSHRMVCLHVQEPCRSFVLRDIICAYCNFCTDLDLCRDPALQVHGWG